MSAAEKKAGKDLSELPWQMFVPAELRHPRPLVVVHGIKTRAERMLSLLVPGAVLNGVAIIAPDFSGPAFKGYQTLAGADRPMQSADALFPVIKAVQQKLGLAEGFDLMGFSGGAQYAHRFAMFYPEQVQRLISVASGWYTYLDSGAEFPYGLGASRHDGGRSADAEGFLAVPKLIAVGELDIERGANLRQTRRFDRGGLNRVERARRWHAHLERLSPGKASFALLHGTDHSVSRAMRQGSLRERIFDFIADRPPLGAVQRGSEKQSG